jgi:hypothetical protein
VWVSSQVFFSVSGRPLIRSGVGTGGSSGGGSGDGNGGGGGGGGGGRCGEPISGGGGGESSWGDGDDGGGGRAMVVAVVAAAASAPVCSIAHCSNTKQHVVSASEIVHGPSDGAERCMFAATNLVSNKGPSVPLH